MSVLKSAITKVLERVKVLSHTLNELLELWMRFRTSPVQK
jgi:hypothetical protein